MPKFHFVCLILLQNRQYSTLLMLDLIISPQISPGEQNFIVLFIQHSYQISCGNFREKDP